MPIVLQFFPNGEFSQGVDTSGQRLKHVCNKPQTSMQLSNREITNADILQCQRQSMEVPSQIYGQRGAVFSSTTGACYTLVESGDNYCVLTRGSEYTGNGSVRLDTSIYRAVHVGLLKPLVHQSVEFSDKRESRKKLLSMTKRMARNIRNAVYLMEQQEGGKDALSFLTLTLPNLSTDDLSRCCANWDKMVSKFLDWLKVTVRRKGVEFQYVYCTEIQTKRLQIRHEYAPHLHIVFRGRNGRKANWVVTPKQVRKAWVRSIREFVDSKFDDRALENLQRIKYSAARYLSKYISKGHCCVPDTVSEDSIRQLRTHWGGMARSVSQLIRKCTSRFSGTGGHGAVAMGIIRNMETLVEQGLVNYFKRGYVPLGISRATGMEFGLHIGSGCLSTPSYTGGVSKLFDFLHRRFPGWDCYEL